MNIGVYQGAASLAALERWQDTVSQNIAAASVPGFRKTEASFEAVLGDSTKVGSAGSFTKDAQGVMPHQVERISMEQGELHMTGGDTDFAIQGSGFFQVQQPGGQNGYTRNGGFHISPERTLVTKQGFPVLGDGGPITFNSNGGRISINADGNVIQGETQVGKIAVYDFADPSKLRRVGDGLLAPSDPGVQPAPVERPSVINGAIEGSNVSPLREMVNLVGISRAFEASQRVIAAHDEATDKAIQSLGNPNA